MPSQVNMYKAIWDDIALCWMVSPSLLEHLLQVSNIYEIQYIAEIMINLHLVFKDNYKKTYHNYRPDKNTQSCTVIFHIVWKKSLPATVLEKHSLWSRGVNTGLGHLLTPVPTRQPHIYLTTRLPSDKFHAHYSWFIAMRPEQVMMLEPDDDTLTPVLLNYSWTP